MLHNTYTPTTAVASHLPSAASAQHDRLMPRDLTCWNPQHCLVSVVDDRLMVLRAATELRGAGFADSDILVALAQEFTSLDDARRTRGLLARILSSIRAFGDEALIAAEYVAEARRGHHLLVVFAPGDARTARALAIVARYQAHTIHYYSQWLIRGMHAPADSGALAQAG